MEKLLNLHGLETFYHEKVEPKAEVDGYYEEMTVGDAEQLVSSVYVENSEPYLFRTTGGSADVGNREYVDEILGGTVAWNQLANPNRMTVGFATLTAPDANGLRELYWQSTTWIDSGFLLTSTVVGHKYLVNFNDYNYLDETGLVIAIQLRSSTSSTGGNVYKTLNTDKSQATIFNAVSNSLGLAFGGRGNGDGTKQTILTTKVNVLDLTTMFGSTIADYIYSLEQSTAGAGVAWFRKYFPEPYYAYNSGELISVEGLSSHDMVGFNQYNNGTAKVIGGHQYQITGTYTSLSFDGETITPDSNGLFTPSANGTLTVTGGGDDTCVHLNWSGYRNGEYEKYAKHSYPLDSTLELRGIPKLDANNNMYYDGDTYESDGTVTRKYGIVDLGALNWTYNSNLKAFYYNLVSMKADGALLMCAKYPQSFSSYLENVQDKTIWCRSYAFTPRNVCIKDSTYTNASGFKTAMSGVYLVYELDTPITEEAEPYQQIQICDDFGTEEFVSTSIVPVGHSTRYPANLRDKLQRLPNAASSDGDYVIRQTDSNMSLVPLITPKEIPDAPTSDGTYALKVTVADGTATYSWEVE